MVKKLHTIIKIDFGNVTPAPTPKTFSQMFIEAMEKNPSRVMLTFKQEGEILYLRTTFLYKDGTPKDVICTPATQELIFAILCAFRDDMSKIKDYNATDKELISTDDENVDLRVEMFKAFLASPYTKIYQCPKQFANNDILYFRMEFYVHANRFVSFCLPNSKEMAALYKEARENNIGNNN